MRPSDRAWLVLGAGVLVWDVCCPRGEMLSEASARYADARPVWSRAVIVYTAGHLMHVWPQRVDLFTRVAAALRR